MSRRPPGLTLTDTLFPTRRSSDLRRGIDDRRDKRFVDHDAPPHRAARQQPADAPAVGRDVAQDRPHVGQSRLPDPARELALRSEEHTSELQSLMLISYVFFSLQRKGVRHEYLSLHYQ